VQPKHVGGYNMALPSELWRRTYW